MENIIPTEVQPAKNPLLDRLRLPGTTYRLPSLGVFYTDGELAEDVKNAEVEVYPMTTMDEIILSTPDKLLSGKAIEEVFARCIPQIRKARQLLARDVDFLMVCLRLVTFGQFMTVKHTHDCENAKEHEYSIDLNQIIAQTQSIDPTRVDQEYVITLPNDQRINLKPMSFAGAMGIHELAAMTKQESLTEEEISKFAVTSLSSVINSVDGIRDQAAIREWIVQLPLGWKQLIENKLYDLSNWGLETTVIRKCQDCGEDIELQFSANPISFFM